MELFHVGKYRVAMAAARMMVSVRARASQCRAFCTADQGADSHPRILHEAPEWLVIHKPAGWHSVRAGGAGRRRGQLGCSLERASADALEEQSASRCVEDWLAATVAGQQHLDEAGLCNRLDHVTSGCMLAAKNLRSLERLRAGIRSGDGISKHYLALVSGMLQPSEGSFSLYFSSRYRRSKKVYVSHHRPTAGDRHHGTSQALRSLSSSLPPFLPPFLPSSLLSVCLCVPLSLRSPLLRPSVYPGKRARAHTPGTLYALGAHHTQST
jgi:23S rRNA-/tRNA-specific pseudouridylate synthase